MTKFFRIASRIAAGDILSELRELNDQFRRECGEDIPGFNNILSTKGMGPDKVRAALEDISPKTIRLMGTYPAYPCVKSVVQYIEGLKDG